MAEKKEKIVTPIGFAKWAWLNKPKQFLDDKGKPKGDPKYQIEIYFDPADPDWKALAGGLQKMINDVPVQLDAEKKPMKKQALFKKEMDANDQHTGRFFITFKTSDKFKPGIFDKYGRKMDEATAIGNESKVRINYSPSTYTAFGGGVNLYLNAVQVLELVEYQAHSAESFGFQTEPLPLELAKGPAEPEDDLPF